MKEYVFSELGYFTESQCRAIKEEFQNKTFMNFGISWSNCAGNCTLIIETDYDDTEKEIKNFFLHLILGSINSIRNK